VRRGVSRIVRNPIVRMLYWLSKTDGRLISICTHWARTTQAALGFFVLFTTALAFGAAFYTIRTLGVPAAWPVWIGGAWALFVLFLDREIVGGLGKTTAIVRPLLALVIGTIIAVPIELWIFQGRIDQQLTNQYRYANRDQLNNLQAKEAQMEQNRLG